MDRGQGFTLIELLVVLAIIGILAAIAIPQFAAYRQKAYDARAVHDFGNGVAAEEAYYATHFTYVDVGPTDGTAQEFDEPGFIVSETVILEFTARESAFSGTATSTRGSGIVYSYDSDTDTLVGN